MSKKTCVVDIVAVEHGTDLLSRDVGDKSTYDARNGTEERNRALRIAPFRRMTCMGRNVCEL